LSISTQDSIVGDVGVELLLPLLHDVMLNASNNAKGIMASLVDEYFIFVLKDVF
jgi:hypothetical protein